jgi:hypothetical protein
MDNGIQPRTIDIKSLILTVRGAQVLLDSDVALLYGYETKYINRTVSRNKARFPEDFCFQLTKAETESIERLRFHFGTSSSAQNADTNSRSQNGTSSLGQHGGRRYRPYVFAEQGIAMLSGLLRNDVAVQVSTGIMRAFVEMRRFISVYGATFERLTNVEYKLLEHDKKFDELFDRIQLSGLPRQGIFFQGQIYDAYKLITSIIREAVGSIAIVDNYVDESVLEMLESKADGVCVSIITANPGRVPRQHITKFNQQYPKVKVVESKEFHDRFIIIDNAKAYHVGASLKDAGKKCFGLFAIEDAGDLINKISQLL